MTGISVYVSYRCDGDELATAHLIRDEHGTMRIDACTDGEDGLQVLERILREALDAVERRRILGPCVPPSPSRS